MVNDLSEKLTREELLQFKPTRRDFLWSVDNKDLVHITVPKFQRPIGNKLCKLLHRSATFQADMDKIGSYIWRRCDGKTSVAIILNELKKKFPDEKNIDQRLFHFLFEIRQLDYLEF
jgi:hypothetical protein